MLFSSSLPVNAVGSFLRSSPPGRQASRRLLIWDFLILRVSVSTTPSATKLEVETPGSSLLRWKSQKIVHIFSCLNPFEWKLNLFECIKIYQNSNLTESNLISHGWTKLRLRILERTRLLRLLDDLYSVRLQALYVGQLHDSGVQRSLVVTKEIN